MAKKPTKSPNSRPDSLRQYQSTPGAGRTNPRPAPVSPETAGEESHRPERPASTTIKPRPTVNRKPPQSNNGPLFIIGGIVLLALAAFVFLLLSANQAGNNVAQVTPAEGDIPVGTDAAAQVRTYPDQGQQHLQTGETVEKILGRGYNSNPPTSGPHLPTWSNNGVFNQRLADELLIHNMEHGSIVIHYDCPGGCPAAINNLSAYARRYPADNFTGVVLAPRPLPNGARLAVSAWGNQLLLTSLDRQKIEQFIVTYIGKGPEKDPQFRP